MEINFRYIAIFLVSLLMSCATYEITSQDVQGTYRQVENNRIELSLYKGKFVLKDNFEPSHLDIELYKCCDTIAYGKWQIDNGYLELSSPEELSTYYLNMYVEEEVKSTHNSKTTVVIENPIESYYDKNNEDFRELYYSINATDIRGNSIKKKTDLSNKVDLETPNGINSFEITVEPKYNIAIRNVATREVFTIPYQVKNPKANFFKIKIPELNYPYLTYKSLEKDYIKILSKNKLLWDGKEYVRK